MPFMKLKVKCNSCNDWGFVKQEAVNIYGVKQGYFIDVKCPKYCGGKRKPTDSWEYLK